MISAAETSSDLHAARLVRALRLELGRKGEKLDLFGIGGPALQAEGLRTIVDARELLAMGFTEILGRLAKIRQALEALVSAAEVEKPDLALVVDYPDFHFRFATRLKSLGIPCVYFIPPKVWVWRKSRIRALKDLFVGVMTIFPFETEFFQREGLAVEYVGNPLLDELPLTLSKEEARSKQGFAPGELHIALLPGSRPAELKRHLHLFLDAGVRAAANCRSKGKLGAQTQLFLHLTLPLTADRESIELRIADWAKRGGWDLASSIVRVSLSFGDSAEILRACDAAIIKSGTATLEGALMECPHVVTYKPGAISEFIFKTFIRYKDPVGLVNLVMRENGQSVRIVPELLMDDATVAGLADELTLLLTQESVSRKQVAGFKAIRSRLQEGLNGGSPSSRAAAQVLKWATTARVGGAS